nr:MAG TPA: hypothetical protein [Caudoviricetes sp.]DAN25724.1 MAG TPA: hypothetical protein [Bacteriophage sp.]
MLAIIYQIVKAIKGKVRKTEDSSPEIEKKKAKKTSPITRALGIV